MEANFFRCLAPRLGETLAGRRIDRIFNPAPGVWTFKARSGAGSYLVFRASKKGGLLFISKEKPANPPQPTAICMWMRKRLEGRRLLDAFIDWQQRSIAWELSPGEGRYLLLNVEKEPALVDELPAAFGDEAPWPDPQRVLTDRDVWREHPQISPALRRTIGALPEARAAAMIGALERGGCGRFFVYPKGENTRGGEALVWRLPDPLHAGREEQTFDDVLTAADLWGRTELFPELARLAVAGELDRIKAQRRKLKRSLKKLDAEEDRMRGFVAKAEEGQLLQGWLYMFDKDEKRSYVDLPDATGEEVRIQLDPRRTVRENMDRLFKLAAKGRRGLGFAVERRKALEGELQALDGTSAAVQEGKQAPRATGEREVRGRLQGLQVAAFRTSDGFTVYRGKSAKGNHEILSRLASPFDLWFHAANGPGAHAVLKRDYPDQDVPDSSLAEAAALAGLKSHYGSAGKAEVMCALVKYVRKTKGAALGQVAVDRVEHTLHVDLDPSLQDDLFVC